MSEWKECKLGDVAEVYNGYSFKSGEYHSFHPGHLEVLKMGHIEPGGGLRKLPKKDYMPRESRFEKYILKKNDIVLAMTDMKDSMGILGHPAIIDLDDHYVLNQRVARIIVQDHKNIDFTFLFYQMRSTDFISELQSRAHSGVQVNLTTSAIKDARILLPQLPEQRAIAGVLSSLDDKIDLLHRQNKTLEGMAEALWRKMFVEEADPGWKKGKLGDEMSIIMGQSPPGNTYNEEKQGIVFFQGRAEFDFRFPQTRLYCTEPKRFAKKGDTLVSVRAPVGDINMAYEDCCIGRGLASVRHKRDYTSYTFYKVRSLKDDFDSFEQQGTVFGAIGKDDFNNIDTLIPSERAIQEFEHTAKPIDDKVFANSIQIRTLSRLRDALLPKLVSGEIRVNNE